MLRSAIRSEGSWDEVFHTMDNRMKCWKANPVTAPARTVLFKGCYLQFRELKRDLFNFSTDLSSERIIV